MYIPMSILLLAAPFILFGLGLGLFIAIVGSIAVARFVMRRV